VVDQKTGPFDADGEVDAEDLRTLEKHLGRALPPSPAGEATASTEGPVATLKARSPAFLANGGDVPEALPASRGPAGPADTLSSCRTVVRFPLRVQAFFVQEARRPRLNGFLRSPARAVRGGIGPVCLAGFVEGSDADTWSLRPGLPTLEPDLTGLSLPDLTVLGRTHSTREA